ncbi:DUF4219 domain-containing protein, partial [Cephalotus follicularis]
NMPPFFDGNNYNEWKVKITSFIQSLDYDLWDIVVFGLEMSKEAISKTKFRYDEKEKEMLKVNAKAKHIIFCALNLTCLIPFPLITRKRKFGISWKIYMKKRMMKKQACV